MALDELNETTPLSRWDLDIGDLSKSLEEGAEFIFSYIAGKTANEDGSVVGIGKLVHGLGSAVVPNRRITHRVCTAHHLATWTALSATHAGRATGHTTRPSASLVLWSCRGDTHGTIAAVNTLHLLKRILLVRFIREAHKAITAGHARDRIRHNLGRLARWVFVLEKRDKDVFINLRPKVTNKNGVLWPAVVLIAVSKASP